MLKWRGRSEMRHLLITIAILCSALAFWPGARVVAERQSLVVIAHPALKASSVHVSELRALFLRQTEQLGGERACPINYPAGQPLRLDFDERVLGMNEDEVGRYWVDARIRGFGVPPRTIPMPQLVVRAVAVLPGAVGYVPKALVANTKAKLLRVDGLSKPL